MVKDPTQKPKGTPDVLNDVWDADGNFLRTSLSTSNGKDISVQYPLPTDGDSIYVKDLDLPRCNNGDFQPVAGTGATGTVEDYFNSLTSINENTTTDNPKVIELRFKRSIQTSSIGFGCNDLTKGLGTSITVDILGSGDEIRDSITKNVTNPNSFVIDFEPQTANGMTIKFNDSSNICLSNMIIYKSINTNSRIQAIKPNGELVDVSASNNGNLNVNVNEYGDTPSIDAFARLRVSENFTIFDSKQLHDKQPLFWDEVIGGNATSVHIPVDAETQMSVTANSADYVIRQTKQRFNYQPGKSQLIFQTFTCKCIAGVTKRIGLFDDDGTGNNLNPNNGIFFQTTGVESTDKTWNIAKAGTTTETINQTQWNVDTLDGSGDENNPSGILLDLNQTQISIIDFEWLGVGRVRVGFVIDGIIKYVHYFNHANQIGFETVYMSTPNLPLRYDIQTDGTNSGTLDHICGTVISEGGIEKTGILRSVETRNEFSNTLGGGTGTKHALVGIRLKDTYKDVSVIPESVNIILDTNDAFKWELQLNPTINGTWTYNDLPNSSVQFAQVGANTNNTIDSDGIIVARGGASDRDRNTSDDLQTALRIGSSIAGDKDELVLVIGLLSNNQQIWGCLNFRELL